MSKHVIEYNGYTIDYTPFEAGNQEYGAQWTITNNDLRATNDAPHKSGDLVERGTEEEMAEFGKRDAKRWVDEK